MSILDDAIREHLELKRAHGADDSELKKLEDEAFGPPQRPDEADPFAEAPTEFLAAPGAAPADVPGLADEAAPAGRRPDIGDLQEAPPADAGPAAMPPPATGEVEDELSPAPDAPPPSPTDAADVPLPPPPGDAPAADLAPPTDEALAPPAAEAPSSFFDQFSAPAEEIAPPPTDEAPAPPMDESPTPPAAADTPDEAPAEPADAEPGAEDRHEIVDQPTQMFDVQAHVDAEAAADAPPTAEQPSPSDEEIVDAAQGEPQAAPPPPEDAGPPTEMYEQPALDIRGPDAEVAGRPPAEAEPEEGSSEFDFFNEQRLSDELDQALEAPLPPTDEHLAMPRFGEAPAPEPPAAPDAPADTDETDFDPDTGHEDVLEDTPRFLEDAPEDDDLWFEQKPPKDFDLD